MMACLTVVFLASAFAGFINGYIRKGVDHSAVEKLDETGQMFARYWPGRNVTSSDVHFLILVRNLLQATFFVATAALLILAFRQ